MVVSADEFKTRSRHLNYFRGWCLSVASISFVSFSLSTVVSIQVFFPSNFYLGISFDKENNTTWEISGFHGDDDNEDDALGFDVVWTVLTGVRGAETRKDVINTT